MTPTIVWLASYPRSGNTWLRAFLSSYLSGATHPFALNDLRLGTNAASRALFEEHTQLLSSELTDAEIDSLREEVYRQAARASPTRLFMKIHDACEAAGRPALVPIDLTELVVYLVRNPIDVAVSYAHYRGRSIEWAVDILEREGHVLSSRTASCPELLRQFLGSWSNHVDGWTSSTLPAEVIRYEDLVAKPAESFGRVLRRLGITIDGARLNRALAFVSFAALRRQELTGGFVERPDDSRGLFFRGGRPGEGREWLSDSQISRLVTSHGPQMHRFGYLP